MSNEGDNRPYDPAGTRPKVDPESLRAPEPTPDLPWAEREARAESELEQAVARFDSVHVEQEIGTSQHIGRFQFILGGLIAVGVIAIAAIVIVIVAGRTDTPDAKWSAWHPTGEDALQQIAGHVGPTYRSENGGQIVSVTGGPLEVGTEPKVTPQLIREDPRTKQLELQGGRTALFTLCGTAENCSIPGKSSKARGLYIRREALELALYAMRYTDADQVVVTLPPDPTFPLNRAVYLRRDDVQRELGLPLAATISTPPPRLAAITRSQGASLVDSLTRMYAFQVDQTSDLGVIAMLGDLDTAAESLLASMATTATTPQTMTTPGTATTPQAATTTTPPTTTAPPTATTPQRPSKGKSGQRGG